MLIHPQPDPIAFAIGPVQIHWYGLMYVVAFALFLAFLFLMRYGVLGTLWDAISGETNAPARASFDE